MMAADEKQVSALIRRHEQLKRWTESDTNTEPPTPKRDTIKVKFQDGCVFLAACSSGDRTEVEKLLQRGADINTANVDGLTALHQACIDDNLEMVECLVELGADVDVCDNEGWTPLHATASCAFTEIARYLIKHKANVAAVNNDGDLPYDIAENSDMEKLLQEEMDRQGIDAESARNEEQKQMLEDANEWLRDKTVNEISHPKTGATALHVSSAKGYVQVMETLLKAGVNINALDIDGWTPLHAAAHWGQEEACKLLVENFCDMMAKNHAGHTAFDLAEKDMLKLLEELKEKQASMRDKQDVDKDIILPSGPGQKRRSSVTRMSVDQKQNVIQRNVDEERAALAAFQPNKDVTEDDKIITNISEPADKITSEDAKTERNNERNKQVSQQSQLPSSTRSRPASIATSDPALELRRMDMPKIEELSETDRPVSTPINTSDLPTATTTTTSALSSVATSKPSVTISTTDIFSSPSSNSAVQLQERLAARRPYSSIGSASTSVTSTHSTTADAESKPADRNSYTFGDSYSSYRGNYGVRTSSYHLRQQQSRDAAAASANSAATNISEAKAEDRLSGISNSRIKDRSSVSSTSSHSQLTSTSPTTTTTTTTSTNSVFRRSFEPPKRDEETETQRKAKAKHARQTRRSTQGVSLEDLEKAEEVLRAKDPSKESKESAGDATSSSSALSTSSLNYSSNRDNNHTDASTTESIAVASSTTTTTSILTSTATTTATTTSAGLREDRPISSYRRRTQEEKEKNDVTDAPTSTRSSYRRLREDRDKDKDSSLTTGVASTDATSNYVSRSLRNSALHSSSTGSSSLSTPSSQGLLRSSSLRTTRLRNGDTTSEPISTPRLSVEEDSTKKDDGSQSKDEKKETSAIRARRQRRERRSTGIVYDNEDETDKGKETKTDEKEDALSSRFSSRHSSNSEDKRPVSYSDYSRSTGSLDIDYKKKYEDEKVENDRLRKELEETKTNLRKAQEELDSAMKQKEAARNSESRDKRTMDRKLSEMEEELKKMDALKADNQRLKDENGALIRVISKLSK